MSYRVTNSMMQNVFLGDVYTNLQRLLDQQRQISTGKKYSSPSDNPVDVVRQISLETTLRENTQYQRNMEDGLTWLSNTETALNQMTDVTQRIRELVIAAGNGSYDADTNMTAIAQEIEELKEELRNTANYSVEGRYLLAGLATSSAPFVVGSDGKITYVGNEGNVQFEMEQGVMGDVSLNGRQLFPVDYEAYSVTSVEVPMDFTWEGRNEIIQITVGDRSVKVRIPEKEWTDTDDSTATSDLADYNGFRDADEVGSYTLDEIAAIFNSSLEMGDAGRLVTVEVIKDTAAGTQRLQISSHTGEAVSLTTWQETDLSSFNQSLTGAAVDDSVPFSAAADGELTLTVGGEASVVAISAGDSLEVVAEKINGIDGLSAKIDGAGTVEARLVVTAEGADDTFTLTAEGSGLDLFGLTADEPTVSSTTVDQIADLSHIDLLSRLGMETSLHSVEFASGGSVVTSPSATDAVHWYIGSGSDKAELLINSGDSLSLEELAARIKGVAGEWLDVVVQTDEGDPLSVEGGDSEGATQRLVIRAKDGGAVTILDLAPDSASPNSTLAQSMGLSTAVYATTGGTFPAGTGLDSRMPGYMTVTVGEKDYSVSLFPEDIVTNGQIDAAKVAEQIQEQVGKGSDGQYLVQYQETSAGLAFYTSTGEPLRFVDESFGDPAFGDYSAGIAQALGISAGISTTVDETLAVSAGGSGTIRIESSGRSIDIPLAEGDTLKDIAERIKQYAGTWLDVAYIDRDLDTSGDASLTLAAKDGSALVIYDNDAATVDVGGISTNAAEAFGISTVVRGPDLSTTVGISTNYTMTFDVAGYEHTVDLRQLDLSGDGNLDADELKKLPDLINARFQGQDIRASVSDDGRLVLSSPKGYNFTVSCKATGLEFDPAANGKSPDVSAQAGNSPYGQTVTTRSGSDQTTTDFFGLLDQIADAMRNEDREGLSDTLLGQVDDFLDNLLRCRTQVGALTRRYETSQARLVANYTSTESLYSKISDTDLAEASINFMMAQAVYQASLAVIARIVQPTLVDFLS
ncbi:flagellar hook-associated protein FlgL [Aminithiophilus ramosus]|uniref:Flagellar hook-associated protein FlgL n=1 Tax=Aminithiophilus ramosus TaxID=3029084 RepID=A0A9Q7ANP7_9BACT|nr:flagellar hook-associated protein FlgL [Aminithiophilus ramosus]QTX31476.1 flagellar hook-associated protein FlgL [Aminithiophilus ramosus]